MSAILDSLHLKSIISSQGRTIKELVRSSGVSRAQLARILASSKASVRDATLRKIANALKVDAQGLLVRGVIGEYAQWVNRQYAEIDLRGMGMPGLQRQAVQDVFVDVDVVSQEWREADNECSTPALPGASLQSPMCATEYLASHDRIVLTGNPGAGKTTLLRYVAWKATATPDPKETPIYLRLPELCRACQLDPRVDLVKFVAAQAMAGGCGDVEIALRQELEDKRRYCLVLLDGLDEVGNEEDRRHLVDRLQEFVEQYPQNRYVATSRVIGFEPEVWRGIGFSVVRILPYSESRRRLFAEKWAGIFARAQGKSTAEVLGVLHAAVLSNPRGRALAANPLMLTILVLLNEARGGTLPRRRVDLYEKVVDVFLETWESNKRSVDKFEDTHNIDLDAREFRWLLADLSLAMQKADRTLAPRWWLTERMQQYLQQRLGFESEMAKDACDRILRYLAERTGLIEERGLGLFGFSHRTLQEYFASLGVRDEAEASPSRDVTSGVRDYFYHPQWSEVVRLLAAQLTPPLAESLLSSILDDPDPLGRFLHRAPLLALRCLADGATVPNRRLIGQAFASLEDLGKSRWLGITFDAMDLLEDFKGTRLSDMAKQTRTRILDTARRELGEEDCACLYGLLYFQGVLDASPEAIPEIDPAVAARQSVIDVQGTSHPVVHINAALLQENPQAWYASAGSILENPADARPLKEVLVQEMGRRVATDRRAGVCLRKLLYSAVAPEVRAACATALGAATKGRQPTLRDPLLRGLQRDSDPQVRAACAAALRAVARDDAVVRQRLLELVQADPEDDVRAGAARGLAGAALADSAARNTLFDLAHGEATPERVRVACVWALRAQVGKSPKADESFKSWLVDTRCHALQRVAAQVLAKAIAVERLEWDHDIVEKIEGVLMGLDNPCQCALASLEELADARAIRHGLRLESVLREALRPLSDCVELAFVFGSTARNRQHEESDIDLFVLGDVSLKTLAGPLQQAENTLGRRINPVIHTRESFGAKYAAGDPFILDVYRREKIPVILPDGRTSKEDLDRELRTMATERVAATQ